MKNALLLFTFLIAPLFASTQAMNVTITTTNISCNSNCDGVATANVTGGTAPYTYLWSPMGATTQVVMGLCAGTYTVQVTDAAMATATATCTIIQPSPLTVSPAASQSTICAGGTVTCVTNATGGTPPYTCNWAPSTYITMNGCNMTCTPAANITYTLTVTDANGCTATGNVSIIVGPTPTIVTSEIPASCNGTGTIWAIASGGVAPYVYQWNPGNITTANVTGAFPNTTYTCVVTDANGCSNTATQFHSDSCDYVWPGDANDDAIADNLDILDIGIANSATGTTRANATLTWIGQPSALWGQILASGTDYKWVDCDGNGIINPVDTQAVVLNYGMMHNNRLQQPSYALAAPALKISFDQDSLAAGNAGTITLSFGDTVDQATNIYGIGFRLNYDAAQMMTSSFGMTGGTTWIGTPGNDLMRVVLRPSSSNGYVDVAITRLDQQNVSGFGVLGQIYFTASSTLNGTGNSVLVPMNITNLVVMDAAGQSQPANVINDSIVIADSAIITTVPHYAVNDINLYPNPAKENIQFTVSGNQQQLVIITDLTGRTVYSEMHSPGINSIDVTQLPAGTYILHLNGDSVNQQRFSVVH